jgi:hypothetical protein
LRFRVTAQQRIEYRVEIRSDLAGRLAWSVGYDDGRSMTLRSCIPRPSGDRRACLRGGVPKPLLESLDGTLEARLAGTKDFISVDTVRFANAPECNSSRRDTHSLYSLQGQRVAAR